MKFDDGLSAVLAGTAIASALVITMPLNASAMTGEEVNDIARAVSVLIVDTKEPTARGSGVIIAKEGNTYSVLTANHVVGVNSVYRLVTADKKTHEVPHSQVKVLPNGIDLAIVQFTSDQTYQVAKLANSDTVKEGASVFVSGWPAEGGSIKEVVRQFTSGQVSARLNNSIPQGYSLVYTNITRRGMSGGPVFDAGGRVIGIHGLAETEDPNVIAKRLGLESSKASSLSQLTGKPGFNLAIPINTFLSLAPQAGLYLGVQVENTPPAQAVVAYTQPSQPDDRDTFNINNILQQAVQNTVERGLRRLLPF